ncbi:MULTISPECIES: Cap15 family cyclic dinucleotide receptor domain-containing protein [Vibrio]|uniref:Cap15 family cyclic dinucleotide receptor domain-containing protein n=1 Tax=Vibrio TaxID=662 RepID=UPI001CDC803F|nr:MULTISPECIES: pancortin-3 [Vibrio]MCU8115423.1 pancortin-3 [Vibrio vulnificus]CAH7151071.1 Pancortin-3 [Vibrio chagasii]
MSSMHDYASFDHNRATVGRWLGVGSLMLAGGFANLVVWLRDLTGIEYFVQASLTTGAIYAVLHYLFNKFIWKVKIFKVPDLSGHWSIKGTTLNEDGSEKYPWDGKLDIEQSWEKIAIRLETKSSESYSYTATLAKLAGTSGGWRLSYSYSNTPHMQFSHELNGHKGFCEVIFSENLKTARANYFNSNGRRTFGVMDLERESND